MNPYNVLRRLGTFNAIDARLVTSETDVAVKVKAESRRVDTIYGAFDGLANVRAWSVDADVDIPEGAVLVVDGNVSTIVRGDNGEYWSWLYDRPGTRKLFLTRDSSTT